MGRIQCEFEGRDWGDASTSQKMLRLPTSQQKLERDVGQILQGQILLPWEEPALLTS